MDQLDNKRELDKKLHAIKTLDIPQIEVVYDPLENTVSEGSTSEEKQKSLNGNRDEKPENKKIVTKKNLVFGSIVVLSLIVCLLIGVKTRSRRPAPIPYDLPQVESLEYNEYGKGGEYHGLLYSSDGQIKTIDPCMVKSFNILNNMLLTQIESDSENYYILTKDGYQKAIPINSLEYIISGNGRIIYYLKYLSYQDIELYCYDRIEDKTTKLAQEQWITDVVPSPDGESYAALIKDSDGIERTYLFTNGKKQLLGENIHVFGISDQGTYIYYFNEKNELVCKSGDRYIQIAEKTRDNGETAESIYFNYSKTEVIYTNDVIGSYFMKDGQKPVKICDDFIMDYVQTTYDHRISYQNQLGVYSRFGEIILPVEKFENRIFRTKRSYIKIQEHEEGQYLCGTSSVLTISEDYSKVLFHNTTNATITIQDLESKNEQHQNKITIPDGFKDLLWLDDIVYCLLPDGRVNGYNLKTEEIYNDIFTDVSYWTVDIENHCIYYCNTNNEVFGVGSNRRTQQILNLKCSYLSEYCGKYYAFIEEDGQGKIYLLRGTEAINLLTVD